MLKKLNLIALFFLLTLAVLPLQAQTVKGTANASYQVSNSSFEDWSGATFDGNKTLGGGWSGANVDQMGFKFTMVEPSTTARTGTYSVKCIEKEIGAMGITEVSPSWITLGTPWAYLEGLSTGSATAGTTGGTSFKHRPDSVSVWMIRDANRTPSKGTLDSINFNLVYYAWTGTAKGTSYKNKNNGCTSTERTDEESDIRWETDRNECVRSQAANQVAEGSVRSKVRSYSNWTEVKFPIEYYTNDIPEKMNIILSTSNYPDKRRQDGLGDGNYSLFDDLRLIYSSEIHELRLNNMPYAKFDKDVYEYTYLLGENATLDDIPTITAKRSGRDLSGSEISINYTKNLGDPTTIIVKAEDGSSTTTYTIYFKATESTNSRLANISVENGAFTPSFNAYITDYNVVLPYGTTEAPVINYTLGHEKQTVETSTCNNFPCTATVKVTAEDKSYVTTYKLNFSVGALSDNTLENILVGGKPIPGFKSTTNNYTVEVPVGTTEEPTIEAVSKYADGEQNIVITRNGLNGTSTVVVTPPTGSSRTYKISYKITESSYSYLQDIKLDGVSLVGFDPTTKDYSVNLPVGTETLPAITWVQGDEYQTVDLVNEGVNGTSRITVKAQNGDQTIYRIKFTVVKSTVSTLKNIFVDGVALAGFSADKFNYEYNVPATSKTRPVVTWEAADAYQVVSKNPSSEATASVTGDTKLTVRPQEGSASVYTITFTQKLSSNSKLADLSVAGYAISPVFSPEVTAYTCALNRGTTTVPAINAVKGDDTQVVRIDENGVNGVAKITVKAQSGATTVYTISFSVAVSSDATLKDIKVGGESIEGFAPATLKYTVTLPAGTTVLPSIEAVKNDNAQRVIINRGGLNTITSIQVIAEDGTTQTYELEFSVEKSANATLQNIYVDGVALADFDPEVLNYTYVLADDAVKCPLVTAEGYPGQNISIVTPQLFGTARIEVVPESGAKNVYTVLFTRAKSANNLLSDIQLDGVTIDGFASDVNNYNVVLPMGTTQTPVITYIKGEDTQKVQVISEGFNDATKLNVMAENGSVNTYTINFSVVKSSDSSLSAIMLDGSLIDGFAADKFEYNVELPFGTTSIPVVTYTKASDAANVVANIPAGLGEVALEVTSEDASSKSLYKVNFIVAKQSNANLNNIFVDGVAIADFAADKFDYVIDLMSGAALPSLTYEKADATASVVVKNNNWAGCKFIVTAQDGTTQVYTVTYNVAESQVALLSDIMFYNAKNEIYESLAAFDANTFEYDIVLPWNTKAVYAIQPVPGSKGQRITINEGSVNGKTTIEVLAQDGVTTATYELNFSVEKSSDASISMLYVGGNEVEDFEAGKYDYTVSLDYGTLEAPSIGYAKGSKNGVTIEGQNVIVTERGLYGTSTILVVAEDGVESSIYNVTFKVLGSGSANKPAFILLGENSIALEDNVYDYEFELPLGETELPELSVGKLYPEQEVRIIKNAKSYEVALISNQEGVADVTYTISLKADASEGTAPVESAAYLTGISATEMYPAFNPEVTKYVAKVTSEGEVTYTVDDAVNSVSTSGSTSNKKVFTVTNNANPSDVRTYTVYLHYKNDVIPNGEFTNWTTAKNNSAAKPVSWQVPADYAKEYSQSYIFVTRTYSTGSEVQKGNGYVTLSTRNSLSVLGSYFPGMTTLGTMAVTLKNAGNSSSSISGGITFRNTPDVFTYRYNYAANSDESNNTNTHVYCSLSDGTNQVMAEHIEKTVADQWKIANIPFKYTQGFLPKTMNIVLNAAPTEDANKFNSSWGAEKINEQVSLLHVDYVRFVYSSAIKSVKINGADATLSGNTFILPMDVHYAGGRPTVEIVGEVEDQAYELVWTEETALSYKANIRSYAEDGSYTDYTLDFSRPIETNNNLEELIVNGANILSDATEYTVTVPSSLRQYPDVTVKAASALATTVIAENKAENALSIKVTAENGDEKVYTVKLVKDYSNDVTLKNITVGSYDIAFDPATLNYTVALGTANMPEVTYTKQVDGQVVELTMGDVTTLKVTAENGVDSQTYSIEFTREAVATTALLSKLAVLNGSAISFDANTFNYASELNGDVFAQVAYAKAFASDKLVSVQTDEQSTFELTDGAENTNTYTINYTRPISNNALLANILVNGASINNFNPLTNNYDIIISKGEVYDVEPVLAEEGQSVEVVFDETAQTYTITVTAENGEDTNEYTVSLAQVINNNADLKAIYVDGVLIDGFSANVTDYNYTVASEMPKFSAPAMPSITVEADTEGQNITVTTNGINGVTEIVVIAPDGSTRKEYTINFTEEKSSYVYLNSIAANYVELEDFEPTKADYTVNVQVGEATPVITFEKGDAYQKVEEDVVDNVYKLVVKAENGDTFTYSITFNTTYTSNSSLAGITLDGELIDGFAPDRYDYAVELPVGTKVLPEIGVISAADGQEVQILTNGVNGVAEIVVTADDGVTKSTYTIAFSVKLSEVDTLLNILVDGESLEGFSADVTDYTYPLPVGTREWPIISWVAGDEYQTVNASEEETDMYNKVVKITTLAQDEIHTQAYTVNLVVAKSSNNTLKDIQLDNVSLEGFDSQTTNYVVELPIGTESNPEVTYTLGDEYQTATLEKDGDVVTINVVAEDGSTNKYKVEFVVLHSSNADLAGLYVDYKRIEGFDPAITEYSYILPYGTTEMPVVEYEAGDMWQTFDVLEEGSINGDYVVRVNAEDGETTKSYTIHFSVAKSDNALLASILVGEDVIPNFDAEVFEYTYYLPYGETAIPAVSYVKAMESQVVTQVNATSVNEATTITVVAEDGETTNVYTINWANKESSNANLLNIFVDDKPLEGFDPADNEYEVVLPYGTTELPEVTVEQGDADQSVTIETVDNTTTIVVEAQDGSMNEYIINFIIEKSAENRLKQIYVKGDKLKGFDPEVTEYEIVYPYGTLESEVATIEDLTYDLFDPIERVSPLNDGMLLMLQVTAENGDVRTYVINQSIALNNNSSLADIKVEGKSLPDFNPETLEYVYVLPYGSLIAPTDIEYELSSEDQVAVISINPLGEPTEIFVTAEDGSLTVYRIHFVVDDFDPSTEPTEDNVCVTTLPDGKWRFTTNCSNISLMISTLDGKKLLIADLEIVDVNIPEICSPEANGFVYDAPQGQILVYYFIHMNKRVVKSGKFRSYMVK